MAGGKRKKGKTKVAWKGDGDLSVCFANTASEKRRAPRHYADLLLWLESNGALGPDEAARYRTLAAGRSEETAAAFSFALRLRDLLSRMFNGLAERRELAPELVEAFNGYFDSLPRRRLEPASKTILRWGWAEGREDDLGRPIWGVIVSAAAILTSRFAGKIRRCANPDCDILFVAHNSGSPRRWCNMNACGSAVKSKRHYDRRIKPEMLAWRRLSAQEKARQVAELKRRLGKFEEESTRTSTDSEH